MPDFEDYCRCPGCGVCDAHLEVKKLRQRLLKSQENAKRYQWLKDNARRIDFKGLSISDMGQLDARIDREITDA